MDCVLSLVGMAFFVLRICAVVFPLGVHLPDVPDFVWGQSELDRLNDCIARVTRLRQHLNNCATKNKTNKHTARTIYLKHP